MPITAMQLLLQLAYLDKL